MKYITLKQFCFVGMLLLCMVNPSHAQDTIHISLHDAEEKFIKNNLSLLAEKFNIDIAQASIIQAKLFDNPTLTLNGSLYDSDRKRMFNVSNKNGQYDIAIQQLIRLAGKRNKEIKLATLESQLSEKDFLELLRSLKFELRTTYNDMYFMQQCIAAYDFQIPTLEKLSDSYQDLQSKSVVSTKDALRIKALLYGLKTARADLSMQLLDLVSTLQLLVQDNEHWYMVEKPVEISSAQVNSLQLANLIDTANLYRPDLLKAQFQINVHEQNLKLQKAYAKSDITIGAEFDKRSNYIDNASLLSVSMDLPFFKRNQGNIKAAKFSVAQSKVLADLQQKTVENQVQLAFRKLITADKMMNNRDPLFENQFEQMLLGVTDNFLKKNLSLIEFTDFYQTYTENILQVNQLMNERRQALETLQFTIGKNILHN